MTPAEEQLSAYLDDELDATQRAEVESLLQQNGELRKTLDKLRQVRSWMGELSRPSLVTSKPIAELLAESSNPISPSLNVQRDGLQQSRWFTSDWRWPAGLVTAAAIMLSILAMWPTGESFDVAYSTNSPSEERLATPKPAENANAFRTDSSADASQAIDALPADAVLAEREPSAAMSAKAAVGAEAKDALKNEAESDQGELFMANGLGGGLPAEEQSVGDLQSQANALASNDMPEEALERQAANVGVADAGKKQARVASRESAGGEGGLGGVAMGAPLPDASAAMSRFPNAGAPGAAAADSTGAPGLAASPPMAAPGQTPPLNDSKGKLGYLEGTGSLNKSTDANRFADADVKANSKGRSESRADSLGGLGGGGLGGSAGAMAVPPPNRTLSSVLGERQEKTGEAGQSGFSRIYIEQLGERSRPEEGLQDSRLAEITSNRFEDLLQAAGKGVALESIKVYQISAAKGTVLSSWKEEQKGGVEEFVLRSLQSSRQQRSEGNTDRDSAVRESVERDSKKQSSSVAEDLEATWILLKLTPESWSDLAVKLEQDGEVLREIDPSSVDLPKGLSLSRNKGESTEPSPEKDQRILIIVNLQ
jgi:anti-sigma factor RsiW